MISISPKVSIIIVNYNTKELTRQCIKSVLEKTKGVYYEIILVDNASTECNPEVFSKEFSEITLVKNPANSGFAKGNNLGIEAARGEFILLLNSDTELINDAISLSLARMESSPEIGVLSCRLLYPDGRTQAVASAFPKVSTAAYDILRASKFMSSARKTAVYQTDYVDYDKEYECEWVWGAFFLLRKSTLDKFPQGKLHEDFFMYGEDEQWCWYITKVLGLKSLYFPDGRVTHYLGGSAKTKSNPVDNYFNKMLRNQYLFLCWSKGVFYARVYYFLKIVLSLSEPRKSSWKIAGRYWAFIKDVTLKPLTIEELGGRAKK